MTAWSTLDIYGAWRKVFGKLDVVANLQAAAAFMKAIVRQTGSDRPRQHSPEEKGVGFVMVVPERFIQSGLV